MKSFTVLLAVAAIGLLIAGCTTTVEYSANASANGSEGGAGGAGTQGGAAQPAGTGGAAAPGEADGQETGTPPADEPAQGISGKTYSDLLGSGSGSQCTVSYKDENGAAASLKLYFDGQNSLRMEQGTAYADCPLAVMVYRGDSSGNGMLYLTCPNHEEEALGTEFGTHEPCDWQSMDVEIEWGGIGTSSRGLENGYSSPMLEYLDSPEYTCQPWATDASLFETPGYVCD